MKHLKKLLTLLILLAIIIGTLPFAKSRFASDTKVSVEVMQDNIQNSTSNFRTTSLKPITANLRSITQFEAESTNTLLKSINGGLTWQNISQGLPADEQLEDFFAGDTELYFRIHDELYRSKSNLNTPVWENANIPDLKSKTATSIAFNRSGVTAYNYGGEIYRKMPSSETWFPVHKNFIKYGLQTIFETSDGTIFLGYDRDRGLYKSSDNGKNWKQVHSESWVGEVVEHDGVLIATGTNGIMRSTDMGENWEWAINEGGVGIDIERIEGGFAAIYYNNITKSRRVSISLDKGKTWKTIDEGLQPSMSISSIKQVGNYLLCAHPDGIFRSSNMGKTWSKVHSSVDNAAPAFRIASYFAPANDTRRVFTLYVSNNIVYAVARNFGC